MGHDQIWTRFGHCQFHIEAVGQGQLRSRSSVQHSLTPTKSKAMLAVTNPSNTHDGADKASRSNQDLWIFGYDSNVEGSAVARLEKILGGLLNLTMVGDEAWITYGQASAAILHAAVAEDGLDKVPFLLNHPGSNALAVRLEEALLAVGEEARDPPMPEGASSGRPAR